MVLIFLVLVSKISRGLESECESLKKAGPFTRAYLDTISEEIKLQTNVPSKLQIVLNSVHFNNRIDDNKIDLEVAEQIKAQFKGALIPSNARLNGIPRGKLELYREMHNRYFRKDLSDIFFGPTAEDVFKYRFAFVCSHFARAVYALVQASKIVPEKDLKYVAAVSLPDQTKICSTESQDAMANGHQFLLIKIDGQWMYWNTSSHKLELVSATDWKSWKLKNQIVQFPSLNKMPAEGKVAVRAVEDDPSNPICDNSLSKLRNIYRSGEPSMTKCHWQDSLR